MGENWYSNKELFEKIDALYKEISELRTDLESTRTLIRDYNNLREKVDETATRVHTLMWAVPVLIAGLGLFLTFLNFVMGR